MHAARLNMALFAVLCLAIPLHAQEKPAWTASPSVVYQHNGNYPNAVLVRLFFNACGQNNNGLPTSGPLTGTFKITVTGVGVTASQPDPLPPGSTTCSLTTTLTIPASAQPGMEAINITNDGKENGFAFINFLDATAGPTPDKPEVDVLWEVFTDSLCKDNFGSHLHRDVYCVDVKIGNNSGHALQLAGLGFVRKSPLCAAADDRKKCEAEHDAVSIPNMGYQTIRASAQATSWLSPRSLLVNGTGAFGLVMASFTPFFINPVNKARWSNGASVVSGLSSAVNLVSPDLTVREINNLDDQAFRDGKLIPNNTQVRMVVFVQKKSVAEAIGDVVPQIKTANEITCSEPIPLGYKKDPQIKGKCYPGWEEGLKKCVQKLDCSPTVVKLALGRLIIIGDQIQFIQRIVVDPNVTSQEAPVPTSVESAALSGTSVMLTGSRLDSINNVAIACPDASGNPTAATSVTDFKAMSSKITFSLPSSQQGVAPSTAKPCTVTLTTKSGQTISQPVAPK